MKRVRERLCKCCKEFFSPDYRNTKTQVYCSKSECRKVSKTESQRRWSRNNPDYFKGLDHVERVRDWRRANPDRSRSKGSSDALQDDCSKITLIEQEVKGSLPSSTQTSTPVLQDFCIAQHPVFIGLIAHFTGAVLQDDIYEITRRLEQLGQDVISSNPIRGDRHVQKIPNPPQPNT